MLRKQMPRLLFHPPFEGNRGFSRFLSGRGAVGSVGAPGATTAAPAQDGAAW